MHRTYCCECSADTSSRQCQHSGPLFTLCPTPVYITSYGRHLLCIMLTCQICAPYSGSESSPPQSIQDKRSESSPPQSIQDKRSSTTLTYLPLHNQAKVPQLETVYHEFFAKCLRLTHRFYGILAFKVQIMNYE